MKSNLADDPALTACSKMSRGDGVIGPASELASQSTMSRLLPILGTTKNHARLGASVLKLGMEHLLLRNEGKRQSSICIDVDTMAIEVHSNQRGGKYNGYHKKTVLQPQFVTCGETGDVLGARLRPGTDRETNGFTDFILGIVRTVKTHVLEHRTDMEDRYVELLYKADSWSCARRVILVITPRPGEIFDEFHFLITNLEAAAFSGEDLAKLYRNRGKAEFHQGEMKAACKLSFPSSPRPKTHYRDVLITREEEVLPEDTGAVGTENAVRLQLHMMTYQLLHIARCTLHSVPQVEETEVKEMPAVSSSELCASPTHESAESMDATAEVTDPSAAPDSDADPVLEEEPHMHIRTFKLQVLKVGAFIVHHGRYITFRIAHTAVQAWKQFWDHFQKLHWQALPGS